MLLVLSNKGKGMQSSSEQPLVGEERYVTTLITAAKETIGGRRLKTKREKKADNLNPTKPTTFLSSYPSPSPSSPTSSRKYYSLFSSKYHCWFTTFLHLSPLVLHGSAMLNCTTLTGICTQHCAWLQMTYHMAWQIVLSIPRRPRLSSDRNKIFTLILDFALLLHGLTRKHGA